nr:hypothetical protein [uncultured Holophaga sp.]
MALGLAPKGMQQFMVQHPYALLEGARGIPNDQVPTVEEVEDQFQRILSYSENKRHPETIVKELGVLAHMIQLLTDPSASRGVTPLREDFEGYADQQARYMVVTTQPDWAVKGPIDPRAFLLEAARIKFQRHALLLTQFDESTRQRTTKWDQLSLPFAQLQLSFSEGVHGTASLWILAWRAVGELWISPEISPQQQGAAD